MTSLDKPLAIATGTLLAIIALCSVILFNVTPARADVGCFVGGSIGASINATKLNDGDASLTLGTASPMASPEVGCKATISNTITAGVLGRLDWLNATTKLSFADAKASIKQNSRWMAAATLGLMINPSTELYGLVGLSGSKFSFGDASETFSSYVVGAGLNLDIGQGPLSLFAEVNAFIGKPKTIEEAKISPRDYAARVGLRYKF